jgi:hypothetical protein
MSETPGMTAKKQSDLKTMNPIGIKSNHRDSEERWSALRRFAAPRPAVERCELCGVELPAEHDHLIEPAVRQLRCACQACAILFDHDGDAKYRRVPRDARYLPDFRLTDIQWNALGIPIESLLDLDSWGEIVADNPVLQKMQPDAEALLVNRVRTTREHFLAPIDECYKLVGLVRLHWRGFSGGTKVWEEIDRFFSELKPQ